MTPAAWDVFLAELKNDEGTGPVRNGIFLPYQDTVGKWSIGYGHNLTDNGVKAKIAQQLLEDDAADMFLALQKRFPILSGLSDKRQAAIANVAYNLGVAGIAEFHNMWAAISTGDFVTAAKELLNSKAARQTGLRYARLAQDLEDG